MKKTLGTIAAAAAVVLLTATFGFAQYAAAGATNFPYFQLGCLIVGGLIMVSLKRKYDRAPGNRAKLHVRLVLPGHLPVCDEAL
ncbi:MAG: hypothetical protein CVU51_09820 [Deltaproteobacteria bacterium HGW-Deltaproteobacteria-1]|nr:MAG: hypothetical protein CVU51_09820 [Deltaproteobacteria bacterium HGW-Deltaproteobacteria-1]